MPKVLLPHALLDDTGERPIYVLPRQDDVILGGSAQPGDSRLTADVADTAAILSACRARMPQLDAVAVQAVKVGLRPDRPSVRLELERTAGDRRLVHNYGHGGSRCSRSAWGCAEEVASLLAGN